jgi:hypothetical protein
VSFPLGLENLVASLERHGIRTKVDLDNKRVAFFNRFLDRDAPVIAGATPDRRFVVLSCRLPFRVAAERAADAVVMVAELNRRARVCAWTYDPERGAISVREAVPIHQVEYTDAAVATLVRAIVEEGEREAKGLAVLAR